MPFDYKGLKGEAVWPIFATVIGSTVSLLYDKSLSIRRGIVTVSSGLFCGFFVTPFIISSIPLVIDKSPIDSNSISGLVGATVGLSCTKVVSLLMNVGPDILRSAMSRFGIKGDGKQ